MYKVPGTYGQTVYVSSKQASEPVDRPRQLNSTTIVLEASSTQQLIY